MIDPDHWGLIARRGKAGLWRVTYGDSVTGLTDEEYIRRRSAHLKAMLPGNPDPDQYRIESCNLYNIHNRCAEAFKVGRVLLAGDAAHICNPMGGYGAMSAILDVDGLADCFIGYLTNRAGPEILDTYAKVRRDIFLRYIDTRSRKNLARVADTDPKTALETDGFFRLLSTLQTDKNSMKSFLLVCRRSCITPGICNIANVGTESVEHRVRLHSTLHQLMAMHPGSRHIGLTS